jgi:hypothetical protein
MPRKVCLDMAARLRQQLFRITDRFRQVTTKRENNRKNGTVWPVTNTVTEKMLIHAAFVTRQT